MQAHIIVRPLVTEKSMTDVSKGKYTFMVAKSATKSGIKHAIKGKFNVTVSSVATSIVKGKSQRVGARRLEVAKSQWKKATVTLKKGDKIALFEPGGEEKK
ncbi:MAG: 50S ribosomal protein L23 [Candidatus Levyibacteriota bacterium]